MTIFVRTFTFLYFSIGLVVPLFSQECLSRYFPDSIGDAKVIFVTPSWEEVNQHHLAYCAKYNLPYGPFVNRGAFDRFRNRVIKKAKRISTKIFVLSEIEFETRAKSLQDSALIVVKEMEIFIKALPEKSTYLSKTCFQFHNMKTKSTLEMICFDELIECLKVNDRNIRFRDYVLAKCQ